MKRADDIAKTLGFKSAEDYIIEMYKRTKKLHPIAKMLCVTPKTVCKYLKEHKITIHKERMTTNKLGIFSQNGKKISVAGKVRLKDGFYQAKDIRCLECNKIFCDTRYVSMSKALRVSQEHYKKCKRRIENEN